MASPPTAPLRSPTLRVLVFVGLPLGAGFGALDVMLPAFGAAHGRDCDPLGAGDADVAGPVVEPRAQGPGDGRNLHAQGLLPEFRFRHDRGPRNAVEVRL